MSNLEKEWEKFKKHMIPNDASYSQFVDMKRSFFAGALSTVEILTQLSEQEKEIEKEIDALYKSILQLTKVTPNA